MVYELYHIDVITLFSNRIIFQYQSIISIEILVCFLYKHSLKTDIHSVMTCNNFKNNKAVPVVVGIIVVVCASVVVVGAAVAVAAVVVDTTVAVVAAPVVVITCVVVAGATVVPAVVVGATVVVVTCGVLVGAAVFYI